MGVAPDCRTADDEEEGAAVGGERRGGVPEAAVGGAVFKPEDGGV